MARPLVASPRSTRFGEREETGLSRTREFSLKYGYRARMFGFRANEDPFDVELELWSSGPVIHMWGRIVQTTPKTIRFDRVEGKFYFSGMWTNSYAWAKNY